MGVKTAVGAAETGGLVYVRGSDHHIDTARIARQIVAYVAADNSLQTAIVEPRSAGIVIENRLGEVQVPTYVISRITISRIDCLIAGAAQRIATEESLDQ